MRSWWALALVAIFLVPSASAAVSIDDVDVPERTMAGRPFSVNLTLTNDGDAISVYLFAALYDAEQGASACGPANGPRFRTFTQLVQERVNIPARSTLHYPDRDDRWLHKYNADDVDVAPSTEQFCVFVANASNTPQIEYLAFDTVPLSVRGANALPVASFAWDPQTPGATHDVRFEAEASDADGDPVTFTWDFGYVGTNGRAGGTGPTPTTFFYPAGEYVVTLTASDGLQESTVSHPITIVESEGTPPATPTPTAQDETIPLPGALALVGIAIAVLAWRRRY